MNKSIITTFCCGALLFLMSCGTSKKLEQSTEALAKANSEIAQLNQKISAYESDIAKLKEENIVYGKEAKDCRLAEEYLRKNLESMNKALAEHGTSIRQIYQKVDSSLVKFATAGVDVWYKNGLVHISLEDELMFTSGSTAVSWEGKQALGLVAEEINKYPGVTLYVLGNTDNKPVKTGSKDNWTLSTERANAVVRVLRDEYKVDPSRIISGGRAMYNPIADNDSPEGRAKNRRTDLIVNPNLNRIWELTNTEQ